MRYFFDVAHGARIVVPHASATNVAVLHSRGSLQYPLTKSVGAAPILVKVDWGKVANVASIVAAPFTGGTSLALNAGLRAGAVGVKGLQAAQAGRKVAQAEKGLTAAQAASTTAQTAASNLPKPKVKVTPNRDFGGQFTGNKTRTADSIADIGAGRATQLPGAPAGFPPRNPSSSMQGLIDSTEGAPKRIVENPNHTWDVDNVKQPDGSYANQQGTHSTQQNVETAQQNVDTTQAHEDKISEQHDNMKVDYDNEWNKQTGPMAMASTGAVGVSQVQGRNQANQAKQQAEMERIEGIAEAGRTKSTTGGGQVAVTA
jgi:hypothetical protein